MRHMAQVCHSVTRTTSLLSFLLLREAERDQRADTEVLGVAQFVAGIVLRQTPFGVESVPEVGEDSVVVRELEPVVRYDAEQLAMRGVPRPTKSRPR